MCLSDFDSQSSRPSEPFASRAVTMGQTSSSIRDLCQRLGGVFSSTDAATRRSLSNDDDPKRLINIHNGPQPTRFRSNRISTSKYSALTFLPKFLFGQFRKYSNVFFLCIVLFQVRERRKSIERQAALCADSWLLANSGRFTDGKIHHGRSTDIHSLLCGVEGDHRGRGQ